VLALGCGRVDFDVQVGGATGSLQYVPPFGFAVLDVTAFSLAPAMGPAPATYSITPDLPAGATLDPATGAISGVPALAVDHVMYTVTATAVSGVATAQIQLTALPGSVVVSNIEAGDDDNGTDATCFATPAGGCTLRAAIQTANHQTTRQLILLDATTYTVDSLLDPITNDVDVVGRGPTLTTVQAAGVHPGYGLFSMTTAHQLHVEHMSIQNFGMVNGPVANLTAGSLVLDSCKVSNNASAGSGGVLFVSSGASANVHSCTFDGNSSNGGNGWGGVIDGEGAGTTITVTNCEATNNTAPWGSFSHITAGTTLLLQDSTLWGNTATTAGTLATPGGVYTLVNDTIVHNTNTVVDSAGIYLYSVPASYTVSNTIVAFNTDSSGSQHNCNRRDTSTTITSNGGNILSDPAGNCAAYFQSPGDRLGLDPGLDPAGIGQHGGPTRTYLLAPGSPAIDGGENTDCPMTDQRGLPRPVARLGATALCDVGAVEMQPGE
jgi:CSLREA domain-containing protein